MAKKLLSRLSRLHVVLPDSIKLFAVGVDDQAELMQLVGEQYKQEWALIDDALSSSELEDLESFRVLQLEPVVALNNHVMHILSELLPKSYERGIMGRETVSYSRTVNPQMSLSDFQLAI